MRVAERPLSEVPRWVLSVFGLGFLLQVLLHQFTAQAPQGVYQKLQVPQPSRHYQAVSMGSERLLAYLLLLRLQLHDNQAGLHVSYQNLDYARLSDWIRQLSELLPGSGYPAFLASRVYAQVPDPAKVRQMVLLIQELFHQEPMLHWRRMTEASLLAKHQLQDLELALEIANQVFELPEHPDIPYWARGMKLILLDELNQLESAQILISSMLESGSIKDPDELRFLRFRLLKIQQALSESQQ